MFLVVIKKWNISEKKRVKKPWVTLLIDSLVYDRCIFNALSSLCFTRCSSINGNIESLINWPVWTDWQFWFGWLEKLLKVLYIYRMITFHFTYAMQFVKLLREIFKKCLHCSGFAKVARKSTVIATWKYRVTNKWASLDWLAIGFASKILESPPILHMSRSFFKYWDK